VALSLRQVRYFIAVAENGSVTGAARQLSVSQSNVTEALQTPLLARGVGGRVGSLVRDDDRRDDRDV
jgi:molybdenum-dependent DNA-binding transcriptional regulator ModE